MITIAIGAAVMALVLNAVASVRRSQHNNARSAAIDWVAAAIKQHIASRNDLPVGMGRHQEDYRQLMAAKKLRQSCSAAGSPWQNGHIERFFKTLKHEFLGNIKVYADYRQLWEAIDVSIFSYNQQQRHHSSLGTTPNAYALKHTNPPNLTTIKPVLKRYLRL